MTEEELKRNITETIDDQLNHNLELICSSNYLADRILTLFREAGFINKKGGEDEAINRTT